ncbi:MAG TPA: response regulator [Thermoanaerobaculia bacterium]|jgi:DNA-binding NtrC family response regulator|nr:response regulator [Thermoanaerobaculia bacterium]
MRHSTGVSEETVVTASEKPFTVLLAEDEAMLRVVVRETLRRAGYVVIEAPDGTTGLEILQSDQPIDVLLTDVRMPGLNGYQLAEASLTLRPAMGVMLMTGYADEAIPDAIRDASIPVIRKPFNFASLAEDVRAVIRLG